jgi:membrane protease YdiL (CAAX protease family)
MILAWLCVLAWAVGAFAARTFGVWAALGTTGIVLGIACLSREHAVLVRLRRGGFVAGSLGGLAMTLMTYALYPPIAHAWPKFFHDANHLYGAFTSLSPLIATLLLLPIIVSEELVWRGVVQTAFMHRLGDIPGAVVVAFIYAAAHAPTGSPVLVVAALGCGLVWSALRVWTGGIIASLIAHMIWDFSVLLIHPIVFKT